MKKKIFLFFGLLSLQTIAQVTATGTIQITSATSVNGPPSICKGDTMLIRFKFKWSGVNNNAPMWSFHFTTDNSVVYPIRIFSYSEFYHLQKTVVNSDTIYSFKYQIPANFSGENSMGQILVEVNAGDDVFNPGKSVVIQKCVVTGLEDERLNAVPATYIDLYGNMIKLEIKDGKTRKILTKEE